MRLKERGSDEEGGKWFGGREEPDVSPVKLLFRPHNSYPLNAHA